MPTIANDVHSPESPSLHTLQVPAKSPRANGGANKELLLLFSLFVIALIANFAVEGQRMVLALYTLPTLFSAYKYGRRHAVMTALASSLLAFLVLYFHFTPSVMPRALVLPHEKWFDLALWTGILLVIAYAMGALYERIQSNVRELRGSYRGILLILQHIASSDKYSQNHAYRVAICATKIAEAMELPVEQVDDIRAAALLHDVEKFGISREILFKSANFSDDELQNFQQELAKGNTASTPVGASLRHVIPILLAYQDPAEGKPITYKDAPLESRILAVADVYETLTSGDGGFSPSEAIGNIAERASSEFDPKVVEAFVDAFKQGRAQNETAKL